MKTSYELAQEIKQAMLDGKSKEIVRDLCEQYTKAADKELLIRTKVDSTKTSNDLPLA